MNQEKLFAIGGEGGGISIRKRNDKFVYHHSEFDPTDEGLSVNKTIEYDNFEQAFEVIHNKYRWYFLYILTIHDDYKNYVAKKLIEKLNTESVSENSLLNCKMRLEEILGIKLQIKNNPPDGKPIWTF